MIRVNWQPLIRALGIQLFDHAFGETHGQARLREHLTGSSLVYSSNIVRRIHVGLIHLFCFWRLLEIIGQLLIDHENVHRGRSLTLIGISTPIGFLFIERWRVPKLVLATGNNRVESTKLVRNSPFRNSETIIVKLTLTILVDSTWRSMFIIDSNNLLLWNLHRAATRMRQCRCFGTVILFLVVYFHLVLLHLLTDCDNFCIRSF